MEVQGNAGHLVCAITGQGVSEVGSCSTGAGGSSVKRISDSGNSMPPGQARDGDRKRNKQDGFIVAVGSHQLLAQTGASPTEAWKWH